MCFVQTMVKILDFNERQQIYGVIAASTFQRKGEVTRDLS